MKTNHLFYASICIMLILIGALTTQTAHAESYFWQFTPPLPSPVTCGDDGDIYLDATNVHYQYDLPAGASLDVYVTANGVTNFDHTEAAPSGTGTGTIADYFNGVSASYPLTYVLRYDAVVDKVVVSSSSITFTCGDDGPAIPSLPGGGGVASCLDVTVGSVVGRFTSDAVLEWAPGKDTEPNAVVPAGESAWILGVDSTGAYYKIIWSCAYRWVPIGTMGPNYDGVWNGQPLPTNVVS